MLSQVPSGVILAVPEATTSFTVQIALNRLTERLSCFSVRTKLSITNLLMQAGFTEGMNNK
jgi:hypothetical protein